MQKRALLSWSSGKDSAWTLHRVREAGEVEVVGLLTTLNETFERVAMHGVRDTLLARQAEAAGLPLWRISLPWPCSNEVYEQRMAGAIERAVAAGVAYIIFGDLHLADVRAYREKQFKGTGLTPLFPLWGQDTARLARDMVSAGLRATVTCLDPRQVPHEFAGRVFDEQFLADLPPGVDPCGENGEFHTFCWQAPAFQRSLEVRTGATVERDGFLFTDLLESPDLSRTTPARYPAST